MRKELIKFSICIALLAGLAGCSKSDSVDSTQDAYTKNDADLATYVSQSLPAAKKTSTGLYYVITTANPAGRAPVAKDVVAFNYVLSTLAGVVLDTLYKAPKTPSYGGVGIGGLLTGLDEGLLLIREGEKATFLMPSYLAFGSNSYTQLPAYSNVRFDVQLVRTRTEDELIAAYITANKLTISETTSTGLRFIKTKDNPTGALPITGQTAGLNYSGKLLWSDTPFDKGVFSLTLGTTSVIKGFEEAVRKLREGEKATVIMPSSLGYGVKGSGGIPSSAPLAFDIEVVSVK
jgi:FKBP-type peptidyl-prolyl cis-trans isomerase